jgi:hypothetical protein
MDYQALTIDTEVFRNYGHKLHSGLFATLTQFKLAPVDLIFSEIIIREVQAQLEEQVRSTKSKLQKVLSDTVDYLAVTTVNSESAKSSLISDDSNKEIAEKLVSDFLSSTGAIEIPAGDVNLNDLIKKYFDHEPPFEKTGKKKFEFPDAIALMSLESYAIEKGIKILAVSKDPDWKKYADRSDCIDVVTDLSEAISLIQPALESEWLFDQIKGDLKDDKSMLALTISDGLTDELSLKNPHASATSDVYYESFFIDLELLEYELMKEKNEDIVFRPILQIGETLTIAVRLQIRAQARTDFYLSVKDGVDRESFVLGTIPAEKEISFESEVLLLLSVENANSDANVELQKVMLLGYPSDIDFGYLESADLFK